MKLEEIVYLNLEIEAVTGLQIRGSGGELEIGTTVDANLAVLRNPANNEPYIPGSSLKGKLRSSLEREEGTRSDGEPCGCGKLTCMICLVFGAHKNPKAESAPTRVIVRDAPFTKDYREQFLAREAEGKPGLEIKTENLVNRNTGAAVFPHTGERVLPGAKFSGQILLNIYDTDKGRKDQMVKTLRHAMALVQEAGSLGAAGSRGSGAVKFVVQEKSVNPKDLKL
jgi:CRISPR-associated protein Csm3